MSRLKVIGDTACPSCISKGRDSTGNHLMILENTEGEKFCKCNRCSHYISPSEYDPSQIKPRERVALTDEQVEEVLKEIQDCPIAELKSRKIPKYVAERFGVHVGLSQENGEDVTSHFYPKTKGTYIQGYKVRNLDPKYFYSVGKGKDSDCFGLPQLLKGDTYRRKLFIFEDELSAMSGYYVLDKLKSPAMKQRNMNPSVLALSDGAGSAVACLSRNREHLNEFEEVILCFDNDDAGKEAVREVMKIIPDIKSVSLPMKDANDMLMAGKEKELHNSLLGRAEQPKVEGLTSVLDCLEDALRDPEMGFSYPWPDLTKYTYGQRLGEIVIVGGGVG